MRISFSGIYASHSVWVRNESFAVGAEVCANGFKRALVQFVDARLHLLDLRMKVLIAPFDCILHAAPFLFVNPSPCAHIVFRSQVVRGLFSMGRFDEG